MSPEREPMENDSNSRTAEELEQQTVDVYVERALHGPVFRMSYEHTHTYCEIFYLKSGTWKRATCLLWLRATPTAPATRAKPAASALSCSVNQMYLPA